MRATKPLKVWMVTSEMHRIKKTGGMADAVYGLSGGLLKRGHSVTVVMPNHAGTLGFFIREGLKRGVKISHFTDLNVTLGDQARKTEVFQASFPIKSGNINFFFIDAADCTQFGTRTRLYGYNDDPYRFLFLNRAIYDLYKYVAKVKPELAPDLLHGHDWQSGFTPFFLKRRPNSVHLPFVYNIHNLGYGFGNRFDLAEFSLLINLAMAQEPALFSWDKGIEFHGRVDAHKVALMFSDKIIAVSPEYVQEILSGHTPHPASLYQGVLETRRDDVHGILNGLPEYFGPDHYHEVGFIPETFSAKDLSGRAVNKQVLQAKFDLLIDEKAMTIVWSSRLAGQKGMDVTLKTLPKMIKENPKLQFIFIGDGEEKFVAALKKLSARYPDNLKYSAFVEKDEILALSGADVLLMPSEYEPCGLNQMKAQLMGCVPLVHETGGLKDTVQDSKTGFSFWGLTQKNLSDKMRDAWLAFQNKSSWEEIIRNCMQLDYSWVTQAGLYEELYQEVLARQAD